MGRIRPVVLWLPMSAFIVTALASLAYPKAFVATTQALSDRILATFSDVYAWGCFALLLVVIAILFSPLARVRIGGTDAKPILSKYAWFSITLCTSVSIGLLFWATAEPMFHLYAPARGDVAPGSAAAARVTMGSLFMHWGFTPAAIYAVPGLAIALAHHNFRQPFSLSAPFSAVLGRPVPRAFADALDAIALLTLLFGLSASLGTGIVSLAGGVARLSGTVTNPALLIAVTITIVATFTISSLTGLERGIRILSDINAKFFLVVILLFVMFGPWQAMLYYGGTGVVELVQTYIPRSLVLAPFDDRAWANSWTIFYWANWLAWAPITALFLGRIAVGHTVRAFLLVNFFGPALFSILWMSIFGGAAVHFDLASGGAFKAVLDSAGPEAVLYALLDKFPLSLVSAAVLVLLSFLSYVTAADSNLDVIARMTRTAAPARLSELTVIKIVFAILIGATSLIMVMASGIDGIRVLSNFGGLPALFIVLGFAGTLIVMMLRSGSSALAGGQDSAPASPVAPLGMSAAIVVPSEPEPRPLP